MINKLFYKLTNYLHCRVILVEGKSYLERYYITKHIYLHRFISGDGDRHVHDHPWAWAFSIILLGGYLEETGLGKRINRKFFNFISSTYYHRILSVEPKTWTLFVRGKMIKRWGFLDYNGKYTFAKVSGKQKDYRELPLGRDAEGRAPL